MRHDYTIEQLQHILDQYDDLGFINNALLFPSGFENSNYSVETPRGRFVIKVFEGIGVGPDNVLFELEVMDASFRAGLKTPHVLTTREGMLASKFGEKYSIVMDYIDGENMNKKMISDAVASELGELTGTMDTILKQFPNGNHTRQDYEWDTENFLILEPKLRYLDPVFDRNLLSGVFDRFRSIKPILDTCPRGLIHNDVALHNILVRNAQLAGLLDFSDMAFSPYIQNIAVPMAQTFFCYNWNPHQAALFIQRYRQHHPLSNSELDLLYDLTCARFATLVIEFNYWNKELFGPDNDRSQAIRDFYQFLIRFTNNGKAAFHEQIIV